MRCTSNILQTNSADSDSCVPNPQESDDINTFIY
jgi:hypothetical protein